jgi:hypothetical protein
VYAGGVYDLAEDEALLIAVRVPVAPLYQGFHLANLWGESLDYANHQSSLNGFQTAWDDDGRSCARYVIAHRDPGVANWLDTTGVPVGFMTFRWTYSAVPSETPSVTVEKIAFDEVGARLGASALRVSLADRRRTISERRRHVQRRYRQY